MFFLAFIPKVSLAAVSEDCPWVDSNNSELCDFIKNACVWWNIINWAVNYFDKDKKILKTYKEYKTDIYNEENKVSINDIVNTRWKLFEDNFSIFPETSPFRVIQKTYKVNMSEIYECWINTLKLKEIDTILWDWNSKLLNNPKIAKDFKNKLKEYRASVEKDLTQNCNYKKWDEVPKDIILKETTYEMCKYISTLSYLEIKYKQRPVLEDIINKDYLIWEWKEKKLENWINISYLNNIYDLSLRIKDEIDHTIKVYNTSFDSFSSYQNNFAIHIYLELIKADLTVFRNSLHDTLVPLNQLSSKIINAMKY